MKTEIIDNIKQSDLKYFAGVYMLYWDNCRFFYIGSSNNLLRRKINHICELNTQNHTSENITHIYNVYGFPKFKILKLTEFEETKGCEQHYLDIYNGDVNLLNIATDSRSPQKGISVSMNKNIETGKARWSDERRRKVAEWWSNLENKQKHANSRIGNIQSFDTKQKRLKWFINNHDLLCEQRKGSGNSMAKKVIQLSTLRIFDCAMDAAKEFGFNKVSFRDKLNPKGRLKNNTDFMYYNEYLKTING